MSRKGIGQAAGGIDIAIAHLHESAQKGLACRTYTCERPPALPWEDEAATASFFAHEGCSLPEAARLHRLAARSLGDRAYWAAVAHLVRGQPGASRNLFKFALRRRPSRVLLPPISHPSFDGRMPPTDRLCALRTAAQAAGGGMNA
jgi:hypothetical protein